MINLHSKLFTQNTLEYKQQFSVDVLHNNYTKKHLNIHVGQLFIKLVVFNAQVLLKWVFRAIFQLYHNEIKSHFNEMMMMSTLYRTKTRLVGFWQSQLTDTTVCRQTCHSTQSQLLKDMSLHSVTVTLRHVTPLSHSYSNTCHSTQSQLL